MDVVCEKCKNVIKLPDEKVPKGKAFALTCPKCKHKNSVNSAAEPTAPSKPSNPPPKSEKNDEANDEGPGGGFEFLESGTKTALLCEADAATNAKLRTALESLQYKVLAPNEPREALKQLRFHDFDVVILNEMFGTRNPDVNHVHKHLSQLMMNSRRNIFVGLISERFKTGDNMQTFNKSVNLIINVGDIDRVQKILMRGINDNNTFFRVMRESITKIKG